MWHEKKKIVIQQVSAGFFCIAFLVTFFLALDRQRKNNETYWKRNIYADAAGYYSYLPLTFIYHYNNDLLPAEIEKEVGYGFYREGGKIKTKYTCGVAILQMPFFLLFYGWEKLTRRYTDGFSGIYHYVPFCAAVFYGTWGLWIMFLFIRRFFSFLVSLWVIAIVFWGTNLLYYVMEFSGMSHAYSFFLFSAFAWFSYQFHVSRRIKYFLMVCLTGAMITLIRPTNVLFLSIFFIIEYFLYCRIFPDRYFNYVMVTIVFIVFFIVFLPQFIYWYYISGKPIYYSYGEESFVNWNAPKLKEFLFAPTNGLFTYNPVWVLFLLTSLWLTWKKNTWGVYSLIMTSAIIYLGASWHDWSFGCSFGSRTLVEYTFVMAVPVGFLIEHIKEKKDYIGKAAVLLLLTCLIMVNILLGRKYERCFFGKGMWDWKYYAYLLRPWHYTVSQKYGNEFTSEIYPGGVTMERTHTDSYSYHLTIKGDVDIEIGGGDHEVTIVIATYGCKEGVHYHSWQVRKSTSHSTQTIVLPLSCEAWEKCVLYVENKQQVPVKVKRLTLSVE